MEAAKRFKQLFTGRQRLRFWASCRRGAFAIARSHTGGVALALVFGTALLASTEFGEYLERNLFLRSYFRVADAFHSGPKLDPAIRLIVLDEVSLNQIDRYPTFEEWREIAAVLTAAGYERVLFGGLTHFDSEVGVVGTRRAASRLSRRRRRRIRRRRIECRGRAGGENIGAPQFRHFPAGVVHSWA